MTNDTSYREKGRAVFLAAIMVLSMVAGAAVLAGSAAAEHEPDPQTHDHVDAGLNERYWQGQEVTITNLNENDTIVEFEHEDGEFRQRTPNDSNGEVTIDTSNWATGDWTVTDTDDSSTSNFTISEQTIDEFSFGSDSVAQGDSGTLTIDSARADYNYTLSSDDVDVTEAVNASAEDYIHEETHDDSTIVVVEVSDASRDVEVSIPEGTSTGNVTFDAEVVDTGVTASTTVEVGEATDADAEFTQGTYNQEAGDDVDFGFETSELDSVYVEVIDEHDAYNVTFEVSDYEDDSASLTMNTFEAGNSSVEDVFTAEDASISEERNESSLDGERLKPSRVNVRLYENNPDNDGANQLDRSIIRLQEGSLDSATTWVAPGGTDEDQSSLLDAATQRTDVAGGDYVVTEIQGSGYHSYLTDEDNNFAAGNNNISITVRDTEEAVYGSSDEVTVTNDSVDLLHDAENDTVYAVITPSDIDALEAGETWETEFMIGEDNPYVDEDTSVNSTFSFSERSIEFDFEENDNGQIEVPGGDGSEISGTSTVAPGTEIAVSAFFDTEILDATAEVGEDGSWSTSLDLGEYESGNQFGLQATDQGTPQGANAADTGELDAVITGEDGSVGSSFSVDASADGPVNVGDSASLEYTITNDGDEAGTVNYTVTVDGEEVDSGSAELESGDSTETMTYEDFDTSSAGDVSWEVSTGDETASGSLTVQEEGGETDEGETDEGETDEGETDDGDDGDDDGGQPGFGLVVALFALIGAALLALRRQN